MPGVLQFMGLQRVGYDWATELNWTETITTLLISYTSIQNKKFFFKKRNNSNNSLLHAFSLFLLCFPTPSNVDTCQVPWFCPLSGLLCLHSSSEASIIASVWFIIWRAGDLGPTCFPPLVLWHWTNHFSSLECSFLTCKITAGSYDTWFLCKGLSRLKVYDLHYYSQVVVWGPALTITQGVY